MLEIIVPRDSEDVQVQVTGQGPEVSPAVTILSCSELKDAPKALRLTDIVYSLEFGLVVYLWWDDEAGDSLILPLEGRGRLDLSIIGGIHNPRKEGWTGNVQLSTYHADPESSKSFFLGLEFAKMRM